MANDTFQCSVVTPERAVLECEARFVAYPQLDGEIGILRGRSPLLCRVGIGKLRVETTEGEHQLFVDGGFAQMVDNRLTILTEQAKEISEIDKEAAAEKLKEALASSYRDEKSYVERQNAVARAKVQLKLAQ
jgi:F-type H+-transporting ATPase subunit epsilon